MNESKSRIVKLNRFGIWKNGEKVKEENTFNFLEFSQYTGLSKNGRPRLKRRPRHKMLVNCYREFNIWVKSVRNVFKIVKIVEKTKSKLRGRFQYYGVTDNMYYLEKFNYRVKQSLHHWLNKRSQKKSFTWNSFWNFI